MLPSQRNTAAMERKVLVAFRASQYRTHPKREYNAFFEHGHWWVEHQPSGAQWDAVDTNYGFDFERVSEGDDEYGGGKRRHSKAPGGKRRHGVDPYAVHVWEPGSEVSHVTSRHSSKGKAVKMAQRVVARQGKTARVYDDVGRLRRLWASDVGPAGGKRRHAGGKAIKHKVGYSKLEPVHIFRNDGKSHTFCGVDYDEIQAGLRRKPRMRVTTYEAAEKTAEVAGYEGATGRLSYSGKLCPTCKARAFPAGGVGTLAAEIKNLLRK